MKVVSIETKGTGSKKLVENSRIRLMLNIIQHPVKSSGKYVTNEIIVS